MPCGSSLRRGQTLEERAREVTAALRQLEARLQAGQVRVTVGPSGSLAFTGWSTEDRSQVTDVCAYRLLSAQNSWALRQAVSRAEAQSGRRINPAAVASGMHSHDNGQTWNKGH